MKLKVSKLPKKLFNVLIKPPIIMTMPAYFKITFSSMESLSYYIPIILFFLMINKKFYKFYII